VAKIRFQAKLKTLKNDNGDETIVTVVKAKIPHSMETGSRKDLETGAFVPKHFIKEVKFEHNGKLVMSADWSVGVSKDPYCAFKFKGGAKGDTLTMTWTERKYRENFNENDFDEKTQSVSTKIKQKRPFFKS
jgi:sulfur-oxidizing protein SoxZ